MDPKLYNAALTGNPDLFIQNPTKPLHQYDLLALTTDTHDNILHIAAQNDHLSFISQVMETSLLQPHQKILLICQENARNGRNPLHIAASRGHLQIVKLLIDSYSSLSKLIIRDEIKNNNVETRLEIRVSFGKMEDNDDCPCPPWIARSAQYGETPLNTAIICKHEEVAALILEQDLEKLCSMDDFDGKSPLYDAVHNGVESIALQILESDCCYSLGHVYNNKTLLHGVSAITEQVAIKLLQKHPELFKTSDSRGETFLHEWAHRGELASLQCLLKDKVFSNWSADYNYLLCLRNNFGNNALHCAIFSNKVEVLKLLIDTYRQLFDPNGGQLHEFPWLHQNYRKETPLHLAIERGGEDIVLYLLCLDSRLAGIPNFQGKSPLFLAVECGRANIVQEILHHGTGPFLLGGPKGKNPLHIASKCPGIAGFLVEILGADVMDRKDEDGKAPLDAAAEAGDIEIMNMVMGHSGITSAPYAWVGACKAGHLDAFLAFMNHAGDFKQLCSEQRDTPLHHFKFKTKEEYHKVLETPLMGQLKNATDSEGATPLHRAIERKDIVFVELLLGTHGIDWTIKDNAGQTPMDLLAKLCDELPDWDAMCKRIDMNPRIKTTYIPLKTNLAEVRTTLSVVAALLATITFAAGFTIPGGYNDDGYVIFARKAAFIVFLLSDTYAMCCSMLVLFCLIWAMVCDPDKALVLVDGSVFLLQQSLYGTLVAFMSGVYTVVSRDCLWTAIVVCVMCSLVALAANKSVLYRLLNKFMPSAR